MTGDRSNSGREWLGPALGVAAVGWGANQFAPLLLLYRAELSLSAETVQAAYGLYAAGLIPGLFLSGRLSDRYGRRPLLVFGLLLSAAASALLIAGGEVTGWLFVGRLAAGAASGAAFSAGAASIRELSFVRSARDRSPGARRATVAMTAGFAGGPLVAGLTAQWAPAPTASAYGPHLVLVLLAVPMALRTRETSPPNPDVAFRGSPRLSRAASRRFRGVVLPLAPWVFGASSIGLAYLPGLLPDRTPGSALALGAVLTAATMLAGIAVQPLARSLHRPHTPALVTLALGTVCVGLLLAAQAVLVPWPFLVVAASLVLGAGYGCCMVCGLAEVQRLADAANLARMTAVFQAVAYLGFGAPYLLAVLESALPSPVLLSGAAGLAAATLAATGSGRWRNSTCSMTNSSNNSVS